MNSPDSIVPDVPDPEVTKNKQLPLRDTSPETREPHHVQTQTHGPMFAKLPQSSQNIVKKLHQNLGHPDNRVLQLALRRYGWSESSVRACADFTCPVCVEQQKPKISRPRHLREPRDFNDQVSFDAAEWQDENGKSYRFYHFIDSASNYHVAIPYHQGTTEGLIDAFQSAWLRWAGPPKHLMFDSGTEANSETFGRFLQEHNIQSYVIPTEAHWQLGRAERNGAVIKHMLDKYHKDQPISSDDDFNQGLIHLCNAKNAMSRHEGYTPELWVLGKMKPVPGSLASGQLDSASFSDLDVRPTEGNKFQQMLARREAARIAFIRADHSATLRRALHARSRPERLTFQTGDIVMFWRSGKGVEDGSWHGPTKILMVEDRNLVWVSHLTRIYRCAPEHIRQLSEDEARSVSDDDRRMFFLPDRSGSGVFQYRELTGQQGPPGLHSPLEPPDRPEHQATRNSNNPHDGPETIIVSNPNNQDNSTTNNIPHPPSVAQPDDEPEIPGGSNTAPATSAGDNPEDDVAPWEVPVPVEVNDDLIATHRNHDYWEVSGDQLIRHHVNPRINMFFPEEAWSCPVDPQQIGDMRSSRGDFLSGQTFQKEERWRVNVESHQPMPEPWTGTTTFNLETSSPEHINYHVQTPHHFRGTSAEIFLTMEEVQKCLGKTYGEQEILLASAAKRQKVEVKEKDLSPEERKMFLEAKNKEIDSWLATDTVRKILRSQIPEGQLLRSRWVLTWKHLDEKDQQETGLNKKAKARLVILGYEDPQIDSLPRDSPTLGRDSRMLALQCISSHRWGVKSFDIKTAFLRGSRQDSRILGVEPPAELRCRMKLQDHETCELLKGAYGLINAPLLWYIELKGALQNLGFLVSPLDPCLFVLPKKNSAPGEPYIHGVLGIHVDDGIGGGDAVFAKAIKALEARFPFGSQRQGSFTFTGVGITQEPNGDIVLNQKDYVNDICPIDIPRERRKEHDSKITPNELQQLRGLIGSLQYAATNGRPDLSCRLSLLQAKVTCATVADLMHGNKLLADAKRFSDVSIKIQSMSPDKIRFLSFSDAAFATQEKAHSQKGCLILATTDEIDQTKNSNVSPLVWFSKKINRVVASTLASETYALSGALDLLSWIRMHWAWINNPTINWRNPEITLKTLPNAFAVVDCKSLFDLLQKTSIPQCSEYRTMLEALVIKDRLSEGVHVKWVHSAAQMADALTKEMDTSVLRTFLKHGKCILHDVDEILRQRADKKIRQQWYQQSSSIDSALHVFALMMTAGKGDDQVSSEEL